MPMGRVNRVATTELPIWLGTFRKPEQRQEHISSPFSFRCGCLTGWQAVSRGGHRCFFMTNNTEHFLVLATDVASLKKCPLESSAHFLNLGTCAFQCCVVGVLCVLWTCCRLQILFSSKLWVAFASFTARTF